MPKYSTVGNGRNTSISVYRATRTQQQESSPPFQRTGSMDRIRGIEANSPSCGAPPLARPNLVDILAILDDALSILNHDFSVTDDDDDLLYREDQ